MKLKLFTSTLLMVTVGLSGCKTFVDTEVKLSELLNDENKEIAGNVFIEVSSCASYEDSRLESSSLIKAKQQVPQLFADAEYKECFTKRFDSYAHFAVPIKLNKEKGSKFVSDSHLHLFSREKALLTLGIPPKLNEKFEQLKKNSFGTKSIDMKVDIKVMNDTGEKFPFKVISAYIDGKPFVYGDLTSQPNGGFNVRLSDVSVDAAKEKGLAMVLMK